MNAQISVQAAGFHSGHNATEQSEGPTENTFENFYESVINFDAASVANRSAFSNMTDLNIAMTSQLAVKYTQIQQLNDRITMMSMGSHFQQNHPSPPAAPIQQPPKHYGYSISTNTKRATEMDTETVEEGVKDAAMHAVVEVVVEAVGNIKHRSHPLV